MRIAFLVSDLRTQQPSYGGIHLAWAAHRRGHEVRFVSSRDLSFLDDNTVLATMARARAGDYRRPADFHAALLSAQAVREEDALSSFDVIFLRYNPLREPAGEPPSPVIDFCWRLRLGGALVVNDPQGVRRAWGRLYLTDLPSQVRARTVVSRSPEQIKAFLRDLDGPAVLKPLAHAGGEKVFFLRRRQVKNLNAIISAITRDGYAVAQEYLPEAGAGEKRLLLLGGAPIRVGSQVALYRRLPSPHLQGHSSLQEREKSRPAASPSRRCRFGPAEQRVCDLLRPKLLADGLYFVSVDLAGDKILELNVFAPGGIHSLREIYRIDVALVIIRDLERRSRLRAVYRGTMDPEAAGVV
jgi:glutathione synthase